MSLTLLLVLAITASVGWWLSGYDSKVTGDNKEADLKRRIVRTSITVILMGLGFSGALSGGRFGGFLYIALVVPIALIWVGCLSELFARAFHSLIDSPGHSTSDPNQLTADLDRLAHLFAQGRTEEAIRLGTTLVESSEGSGLAMETMFFRLYDQLFTDDRLLLSPPLAEALSLCEGNRLAEAECRLNLLLKQEPSNLQAAMALLRVYARNTSGHEKAFVLLRDLEARSGVPPFFIAYARERLGQWLTPSLKETEGIESLLVDQKHRKGAE